MEGYVTRAIGWAQHGRRGQLRHIRNRRAFEAGAEGEVPADWRITCSFTDKDYRRRGVGARALEGAIGDSFEAFPEVIEGQKTSAGFLWNATLGMLVKTGFVPIRKIGKHRWLVRRTVEGALR
ncbi:MAG TPA: hypothetical protein DIU07_04335 [Rhodobacteraceae bacterium]|nr:hypothetical protein [Paracoccaceae bacterium]